MTRTILVIGLGSIGGRHALNLESMGHKVLRFDPVTIKGVFLYKTIKESDAVVIASPTDTHDDYIQECVRYNKPMFVEKPIAESNWDDVKENARHVTMVGYNLRLHSCVKQAKAWIDSGKLGKILWASFTCAQYNDKPAYLRDGVILNFASHEVDLALYLLGPAEVINASARTTNGKDDLVDFVLLHKNGVRSTHHSDYLTQPEIRKTVIVGTERTVTIDIPSRIATLSASDSSVRGSALVYTGTDSFDENYKEEMQAFLDRIDGHNTIGCTGEEGLKVLEICLAVRKQAGLS